MNFCIYAFLGDLRLELKDVTAKEPEKNANLVGLRWFQHWGGSDVSFFWSEERWQQSSRRSQYAS